MRFPAFTILSARLSLGAALMLTTACAGTDATDSGTGDTTDTSDGSEGESSSSGESSGDGDTTSGDGDGSTGDGDGSTGDGDGDGDGTTGDGDGDGDGDVCDSCIGGACATEFSACEAESGCLCWLDCEQSDTVCTQMCGLPTQALTDVVECYFGAIDVGGACFSQCNDPCDGCFLTECGDEWNACVADTDCTCWADCTETNPDPICMQMCGAPPSSWDDVLTCWDTSVGAGGACEAVCS
jgi:hypothetical protein